jgi:head-tail adaptor
MRKNLRITIVVLILLFLAAVAKDFIIKSAVSSLANRLVGAKISIGSLSLGVINNTVRIKNFRMYNPKGFSRSILVDLPKITVKYNFASLVKGKMDFSFVEVELKELNLEKNKSGKLNVDSLSIVQEQPGRKPAGAQKPTELKIGLLNLDIGKIISKDYSQGGEPAVAVYDINLKKSYRNISSVQQLVLLILSEPMKSAGIRAANIYGIAALTGVGLIPVAVISTFSANDSVEEHFAVPLERLYAKTKEVLGRRGIITSEDKANNVIIAKVNGTNITAKFRISYNKAVVAISARKFLLPKREIASGILYQIEQEVK